MAFSRLFGKSKKDPPSPSGSNHSPDLSEREGEDNFTMIDPKPVTSVQNDFPPSYNSVSQLPYQLPSRGGGGGAPAAGGTGGGGGKPTLESQLSHPLEGVVFHLSPKLTTDSEIDQMAVTVDNLMSRLRNIEWATFEYSFSLEQSVLSSDLDLDGARIN